MLARRTEVYIEYENKDISADIKAYLLDFSYQDNEDEADDLQITLEDKAELWQEDWFPDKGAVIRAEITTINYDYEGQVRKLNCGAFEIDDLSCDGPPNTVKVKAISIPVSNGVNQEKKTKTWEGTSFSGIVSDIASANGMGVNLNISTNRSYDRIDQNQESDLVFIERLCNDLNFSVKVVDFNIVIVDDTLFSSKPVMRTITKGEASLKAYSFNINSIGAYNAARISYKDPKDGELIDVEVNNTVDHGSGKTLKINQRVKSEGEAKDLGKKKLDEENKKTRTAKFEIAGDIDLVSKQTVEAKGWGKFDGKYLINSATHSVNTSGYVVDIECSKE